jgi:hypothetical protein
MSERYVHSIDAEKKEVVTINILCKPDLLSNLITAITGFGIKVGELELVGNRLVVEKEHFASVLEILRQFPNITIGSHADGRII